MAVSLIMEERRPILNVDFHIERKECRLGPSYWQWQENGFSRGSLYVDKHFYVRVVNNKGSIPEFVELLHVLAGSKRGVRVLQDAFKFKRKNPYRIDVRVGDSGCFDYSLISAREIDDGVWIKEVKTRLHISMYEKCNYTEQLEKGIFLPDLLAILKQFKPDAYEFLRRTVSHYGRRKAASIIRYHAKKVERRYIKYNHPSIIIDVGMHNSGWIKDQEED